MCHVSCVMCHVSRVTCHMSHVTCHLSRVTYHTSKKMFTCDSWHVTCDTWHVTCDTWHMTHSVGWTFSQNFSSLALPVWDWQCFEYISTNHDLRGLARYSVYMTATSGPFWTATTKPWNYPYGVFLVSSWLIDSGSYKKNQRSHITNHTSHITNHTFDNRKLPICLMHIL